MNNDFYKRLTEKSPSGYAYHKIICDDDGIPFDYEFIEANDAFEEFTGLKRSETMGKKITEILPGITEDPFDWIKYYGDIALNGGEKEFEQFSEPLNRWYRVTAFSPEKGYFVTRFIDISQEKSRLEELDTFFEINLDLLCIADTEGNFIKTNKAWEGILGYSTAELNNKKFLDFVHPDDTQATLKAMKKLGRQMEVLNFVNRYLCKDGSYHLIEWHYKSRGRLIYAAARDITEGKRMEEDLKSEQTFTQRILESLPGIFYLYTYPQLRLVRYNKNHETLLGYEPGEIIDRHLMEWHIPEAKSVVKEVIDSVMLAGRGSIESPLLSKDGRYVPFLMTGVSFDTPKQRYLIGIGIDITEREQMEKQIFNEKEQFKTTLLSVGDGVISTDKEGRVLLLNKAAEQLTGWTQHEAFNQPLEQIFHIINEFTRERSENPAHKVLATGDFFTPPNHTILVSKDNIERPIEDSAAPIKDENGNINGAVLVFRDFTEKKQKQKQIEYLSFHDQLTGLYNRRFYEEELIRLDIPQNLPLTIVMGDINGLKLINDSFGHAIGDELLQKASKVLTRGCRVDDVISRIGGDEFVILLPKTDAIEASRIIRRIQNLATKEKAGSIYVSFSFGYETKHNPKDKIQDVFKSAEDHMYSNKLFESPSMKTRTIDSIIKALYEDNKGEEQHSQRVSELCKGMGEVLGLPECKIRDLKAFGLLHDIGKIALDENLLNKPGKLTEDEWQEIKRHSEIGYRMLSAINETSEMAEVVLGHHERWDGKGYPRGLKGEEIPVESRIIAIAEAYDAMTSERSYRSALPGEAVLAELQINAGIQFDPELVNIFIEKFLKPE